ncbi:hypothetical protein IQ265_10765 [Nodosilinea sp. LEGE 06152]|uniref:hypothetical protein n=1 Tax=Nodosilinea sp. LEGE 06152 TaxID=2777966 RepID=UPI001880AEFF|nr:hypothetical protein [Nodosilinea sp. LEGE 06152]MBE9157300.1 hypothetical protein [Nodosilinea sp. LEGE 06152]
MKLHPNLLAASSLLAILSPSAVRASDGILSFELSPPQWTEAAPATEAVAIAPAPDSVDQPLPIPARAANPPMRYHSPQQLPAGVYRRGVAAALNESSATALLPPAPPLPAGAVMVAAVPVEPKPAPAAEAKAAPEQVALDFEMAPSAAVVAMAEAKAAAQLAASQPPANPLLSLFEGNSDSLVARAVGSAEGTRTPNGAINPAYFGHTDPGNRVWNMGTFSYQHGAKTPEEADQKQLARLQNQGDLLRQRALQHGLNLTLEETLNGLDLANQSPLAAIGRVGYIERLAEAKANGLEGSEAILVARTRSYINPNTGWWNAPGLGNTEASIRRDQQRRANAVAQAIAAYEGQNPQLQAKTWTLAPSPEPAPEALVALGDTQAEPVDDFLQMWTSPSDPVAQAEPAVDSALLSQAPQVDSQGEDEPGLVTSGVATGDRVLATLWQFTVDKVSSLGNDAKSEAEPQAAPLAEVLLDRNSSEAETQVTAPEAEAIAVEAAEAAGASAPAPETPAAETPAEPAPPAVAEGTAQGDAPAIASPTWSQAREGSQSSPAAEAEAAATTGAFPHSTVYAPLAPSAEPLAAESVPADIAQAESFSAAPEAMPLPSTAEPEPEAIPAATAEPLAPEGGSAHTPLAELPTPETAELAEQAPAADGEDVLEFAKVDVDKPDVAEDLSAEASPSGISPTTPGETVSETGATSAVDQALVAEPETPVPGQAP